MFGTQFYPSPPWLIERLTAHLYREYKGESYLSQGKILDPSAGKGDILDYIKAKERHHWNPRGKLYAIEIDPALRAVLIDKGHAVIDSDFLEYKGLEYFDHIIMNPPFLYGVQHLLHAFEISHGALIKCVLNAESINNPYSKERRRLLHLIESNQGTVEHVGQVFADAERSTPVEAVIVTLQDKTPQVEDFLKGFDPERMGGDDFELEEIVSRELASANVFDNYESRYLAAIEAFKEMLVVRQKTAYYLKGLVDRDGMNVIGDALKAGESSEKSYKLFLEDVTKRSWDSIFANTKLASITTENVRKQVEKQQAAQGNMAFTAKNMTDLFLDLATNKEQIMIDCVLNVFDGLTKYYHENREMVEGWKSNSAYLVGKKFIIPNLRGYNSGISFQRSEQIRDIERALCFLSGKRFEEISSIVDLYYHKNSFGEKIESEFFETRFFKKGTMHFWWLDESLRQRFNGVVAQHRWGELPEKTKAGVYR